jgi:hypothetical protein
MPGRFKVTGSFHLKFNGIKWLLGVVFRCSGPVNLNLLGIVLIRIVRRIVGCEGNSRPPLLLLES